jgi:SlyX protein
MAMNDAAPGANEIDRRLENLEVKLSFTEDLAEQLNQVVARQQMQIEGLARELQRLREQVRAAQDAATPGGSLRDELPPHY